MILNEILHLKCVSVIKNVSSSRFNFGRNFHQAEKCFNLTKLPTRCISQFTNLRHSKNLSYSCYFNLNIRNFHQSFNNSQNFQRNYNKNTNDIKNTMYILSAIGVLVIGLSYAAVPLYRIFCQSTSYGGTVKEGADSSKVESMKTVKDREITVKFIAEASGFDWNFRPDQSEIKVCPGETALAFYIAKNPTNKPVIGISTYNVLPFEAGQYFNKIQCFCFEEQILNPGEEVHMPVFFYIDPEYDEDPYLENIDNIVLSYTFFEAKEGFKLPLPGFMTR